jgi:hypothetical protein
MSVTFILSQIIYTNNLISGDHVVNLREDILINRIKYSFTTLEDKSREVYLDKAAQGLEK